VRIDERWLHRDEPVARLYYDLVAHLKRESSCARQVFTRTRSGPTNTALRSRMLHREFFYAQPPLAANL
jgi:hypothetical protein